jgi:hypothetical protein
MHLDLAHAVVTILVLFATLLVLRKTGIIADEEGRKFSLKAVAAMALAVFVLNLIWPYGP